MSYKSVNDVWYVLDPFDVEEKIHPDLIVRFITVGVLNCKFKSKLSNQNPAKVEFKDVTG